MQRFIPVEIFRKKSNTFRGITFFPFLPKRPKLSVPLVWITSARLHVQRKREIYRYFVNGTTQSRFCFRCQKKYQYYLTENFHRNFRLQMVNTLSFTGNEDLEITFTYLKEICLKSLFRNISFLTSSHIFYIKTESFETIKMTILYNGKLDLSKPMGFGKKLKISPRLIFGLNSL